MRINRRFLQQYTRYLDTCTRMNRAMCIKGQIWPPLDPKTDSCVSSISSNLFIKIITQVLNSGIYFIFTIAMVTKMADKKGSK